MFDAMVVELFREVPKQMALAAPVIWELVKGNPLVTALILGALLFGGGGDGRRRRVSSRVR